MTNTLKATADNYRRLLSDRLAHELGMTSKLTRLEMALQPTTTGCWLKYTG